MSRKVFGKTLADQGVIRAKLAEMMRLLDALHSNLERVAFAFTSGMPEKEMGSQCALLKVMSSRTFEFCAREASQIFGGAALVRGGRGRIVERLYRDVRGSAIPGGSEEILLDLSIRETLKAAKTAKL